MDLDVDVFVFLFHGSALALCEGSKFEVEILPPSIKHLSIILFDSGLDQKYLNLDLTFSILFKAILRFLSLILETFMRIRYLKISSDVPLILR